jgi:Uma2 family endonuclease
MGVEMALTQQLTLDEFQLLPEERPALEYERGVVTQKMAAMGRHSRLQVALCIRFESHGHPQQIASALSEARITWPVEGISYVPDVSAYLVERVPIDQDGEVKNYLDVPPDVAVEIWSPGQGLEKQMDRCRWYVAHGVPVSLLVHPERRTVWTFRPGAESGPLQSSDVINLGDIFPGLSFTVADLFAKLRPRPA